MTARNWVPLFVLGASLLPLPSTGSPGCLKAVTGGEGHTLALLDDGTVYAWGSNMSGQLGNGTTTDSFLPVQVSGLSGVSSLGNEEEAGFHSLALKSDGTVWAWGLNSLGELGDGTTINSSIPVKVTGLSNAIAIAGHSRWSQALVSDGTVWAWGENSTGQLGDGSNMNATVPVRVVGVTDVVSIAGGGWWHALALRSDGTVWAWGGNYDGQLGNGTLGGNVPPVRAFGIGGPANPIVAIAGGGSHSLAVDSRGQVYAWGANESGQLGNGTGTDSTIPVPVVNMTNATAIAGGLAHSLALRADGTVWAWGQLAFSAWPVQVLGLADVIAISSGDDFAMAITADGSLWEWGNNQYGQLGTDPLILPSTVVPIRVNTSFSDAIPLDQSNVLRAVKNSPDVALDFAGAPASQWRLHRDPLKTQLAMTPLSPDARVARYLDPGAVPALPTLYFYRLKGLSPCSLTPGP